MKTLRRVKKWMEWRGIEARDIMAMGVAFSMLITVTGFGIYCMLIALAAYIAP